MLLEGLLYCEKRYVNVSASSLSVFQNVFFFNFIYLFLERGEGKGKERERNINVWLPLACSLLGTWPATQACALTGNRTSNPLVHRTTLSPLSQTRQGSGSLIILYLPIYLWWCEVIQCLSDERQWGGRHRRCDIALGCYWHSDILTKHFTASCGHIRIASITTLWGHCAVK